MKIKTLFILGIISISSLMSCTQGIEYDEVPESVYTELGLGNGLCKIRVRELFEDKVWQTNYNNGKGQWLEKAIFMTQISQGYQDGKNYVNNTEASVTIMGNVVKPGDTIFVQNTLEEVADASAPEGKKYIIHLFSPKTAQYSTPNKGHLFVESAFSGDPVKPILVDPIEGQSQSIILPVRQDALVVEFILANDNACRVDPVDGAPALGTPGDYTIPQKYIVTNYAYRPAGVPEFKRLYEVKVQLLDEN